MSWTARAVATLDLVRGVQKHKDVKREECVTPVKDRTE